VELAIPVPDLVPSVFKDTTGIENGGDCLPDVKFHLFFTLDFAI
jgi:hypothetical protein